jgi:hypothetical protein
MECLLGQDMADRITPLSCALERVHAEQKTSDTGCEMRFFIPRSGDGEYESGLPVHRHRQETGMALFFSVSPRFDSSPARSLLRGLCDALRHCAVLLSGLLSRNRSGPLLQNARLGAWESRPLA